MSRDHLKLVSTTDKNGNAVRRWSRKDDRHANLPADVEPSVKMPQPPQAPGDQGIVQNESLFIMPEIDGHEVNATQCFSMNDSMRDQLTSRGKGCPDTLYEVSGRAGAEVYHDRLAGIAEHSKFGAAVDVPSVDDLDSDSHRMFLNEDGSCGFILKQYEGEEGHKNIVGVFAGPGSPPKSADSMLLAAVAQGGEKLDCYDTVLPKLYSGVGFTETSRLEWDDQYKPEGWDYDTFSQYNDGRPDVIFMSFDRERSPYFSDQAEAVS